MSCYSQQMVAGFRERERERVCVCACVCFRHCHVFYLRVTSSTKHGNKLLPSNGSCFKLSFFLCVFFHTCFGFVSLYLLFYQDVRSSEPISISILPDILNGRLYSFNFFLFLYCLASSSFVFIHLSALR